MFCKTTRSGRGLEFHCNGRDSLCAKTTLPHATPNRAPPESWGFSLRQRFKRKRTNTHATDNMPAGNEANCENKIPHNSTHTHVPA